jgi:hypothetical protein
VHGPHFSVSYMMTSFRKFVADSAYLLLGHKRYTHLRNYYNSHKGKTSGIRRRKRFALVIFRGQYDDIEDVAYLERWLNMAFIDISLTVFLPHYPAPSAPRLQSRIQELQAAEEWRNLASLAEVATFTKSTDRVDQLRAAGGMAIRRLLFRKRFDAVIVVPTKRRIVTDFYALRPLLDVVYGKK